MMGYGLQRPLQKTFELESTDSGVVVLNSATRNAKSKAQLNIFNISQSHLFNKNLPNSLITSGNGQKVVSVEVGNHNMNEPLYRGMEGHLHIYPNTEP